MSTVNIRQIERIYKTMYAGTKKCTEESSIYKGLIKGRLITISVYPKHEYVIFTDNATNKRVVKELVR